MGSCSEKSSCSLGMCLAVYILQLILWEVSGFAKVYKRLLFPGLFLIVVNNYKKIIVLNNCLNPEYPHCSGTSKTTTKGPNISCSTL